MSKNKFFKKLDIPYYSQYRDVKDKYWKPRACGAICLKMVLDYIQLGDKKSQDGPVIFGELSVEGFVKSADEKGAYGEYGWVHQGLVDVAKDFDVKMEGKEFKVKIEKNNSFEKISCEMGEKNEDLDRAKLGDGIREIVFALKNNKPVLVSAIKKWKEMKKFHMVVLTGFETDESGKVKGFYYNDTDYNNEQEGKNLFVDIEIFKKYWRRLAIFVK